MFYAVIHRPRIDTTTINEVCRKYHPHYGLVGPHITLIFPFKADGIVLPELKAHIQKVAQHTGLFEVRLHKLELSWDQWLYLTPTTGRDELKRLHTELQKGMLKEFPPISKKFIPHVSLGYFAVANSDYSLKNPTSAPLDEEKYKTAREEIEAKDLDFTYTATSLELISVNDEFAQSKIMSKFDFQSENN